MPEALATERLFFALRPDAPAAARAHELALRLRAVYGLKGHPLPVERLHVTLCFLGDYAGLPRAPLDHIDAAGRALQAAPFGLALDCVMSFARNRGGAPLVLCRDGDSAPLARLRNDLVAELDRTGCLPPGARGFTPHVTLLYDGTMIPLQAVLPVCWTVTEVLLIRSLIGRGRHEVLGSYPLG